MGMLTPVGAGAAVTSGGESQRIRSEGDACAGALCPARECGRFTSAGSFCDNAVLIAATMPDPRSQSPCCR